MVHLESIGQELVRAPVEDWPGPKAALLGGGSCPGGGRGGNGRDDVDLIGGIRWRSPDITTWIDLEAIYGNGRMSSARRRVAADRPISS